jgi:hypothetical protein
MGILVMGQGKPVMRWVVVTMVASKPGVSLAVAMLLEMRRGLGA